MEHAQTVKKSIPAALKALLGNGPYMLSLTLTAVIAYGFSVAHNSISVDDFTSEIYYPWGGDMVAQGRFTIVLFAHIFRMLKNVPYFCDVLSVVCFALAAMLFCIFFDRAMGGSLSDGAKIVFSCVLVSYPAIHEIFVYGGGNFNVCLGYVMTAAALLLFQRWYAEKKRAALVWLAVDLFFVVSLYESFAVVFLCGVIMLLLLNFYYNPDDAERARFGNVLGKGLVAIGILAAAVIAEFVCGRLVLKLTGMEASVNAANSLLWLDPASNPKELIVMLLSDYALLYIVSAPHYLPILIFDVFVVIGLVWGVAAWIRHKNFTVCALFLSLVFLQFFLSLLGGQVSPLRTCQQYGVYIAFLSMLMFVRCNRFASRAKKPALRRALPVISGLLAFWLIFVQAYDLNNWLCLDVQRSEEEIAVAREIGNRLQAEYDVKNTPVLFVGNYEISESILAQCTLPQDDSLQMRVAAVFEKLGLHQVYENISTYYGKERYKFVQSSLSSYLGWAVSAFRLPNQELMKLYQYLGYDFHTVDSFADYAAYSGFCAMMPAYPDPGYIMEGDGLIIVNLGKTIPDELSALLQDAGDAEE